MSKYFLGRTQELATLNTYHQRGVSCFLVIKGRRRIGKSRLVEEFAKGKKFYRFSGLPPERNMTAQMQRDDFARRLIQYFPELPTLKANEWSELFQILAQKTQTEVAIILLDEITWMAIDDPAFLGKLKNAWDECFKNNPNLMLILCSSISSWVEKNLLASTAFLGRIHYVMNLKELPLSVCTAFWEEHRSHVSAYDQLKFLAITGGVPLYLESLNPNIPVDDNIQQLCFDSGGLLFREFDNIFHDLFDDRSAYYKQIVSTLVHENLDLASISRKLGTVSGGVMSECLANLVEAGFVSRDYIWSFKTGIPSKLSRYRLSDNYIRFYLHYIDPQKAKIERGLYQNHTFSSLPGWPAMMGLQFENLILANRYIIWEKLGLTVNDIVNDGSYFQKQTTQHAGCQIDYLIQTRYNNLFVCEIKFSRNAITKEVISEMQQKISRLVLPKHFSCFPVLIHANEVSDFVIDANYFSKIIDLGRLIKS